MIELLAVGAVSFAVGLSGALSPGPLVVLTIREAARRGWWAGPLAAAGHAVVEFALVIALALGLSRAVEEGAGTAAISIAGGAILLWMGWSLLHTPTARLQEELAAVDPSDGAGVPSVRALLAVASAGALATVANPYWAVWWATVGTKLTVDSLAAGPVGPGAFAVGHVLSDLVWLTLVALIVGSGRSRMGGGAYRLLLAGCGLFLLAMGLFFFGGGVMAL